MPIYIYTAKKGPDEVLTGEIEAVSEEQAISKIEKMGLVPVKISAKMPSTVTGKETPAKQESVLAQKIKIKASLVTVKSRDLDTFTRQLASLVKANVPMLQALALLSRQTENKILKGIVADMGMKIKDGRMLSESMTAYPKIFNNLYLSMIHSGERSGTLDEALYRLAEHREREQELKHRIQAALAYPILVTIVGAGTIFVMLTYFLPKLTRIFKGMKQELPLPTKILMGLTDFMSAHWYIFIIAVIFIFVILGRMKSGSRRKMIFDAVKMRIPLMQKFTRDAEIARFARSLAVLLKNGMPVHESLDLAADTLDNEAIKEAIKRAGKSVIEQGLSLSESFSRTKIFPEFTLNMISVGEGSGKVTEALEEIANVYEREVDQSIKIMSSLMEPLLILVVGAIVGFIVFAMLLPVFNIGMGSR